MSMDDFRQLLEMAVAEDSGAAGDITSRAIFSNQQGEGFIVCRQSARLAGIGYAVQVFQRINPVLDCQVLHGDGNDIVAGTEVMIIRGPVADLLRAERIALNFMAYLSGIATQTREHVRIAQELGKTLILDTRKTVPGYRRLAKEAVAIGGGTNHRMGLYDMVMIKDNHIEVAGGITAAVKAVRGSVDHGIKIEVETTTLDQVQEAIDAKADIIMLDNMDIETMRKSVELIAGRAKVEASGNITLERLREVAATGVDFISIWALTHSVSALYISQLTED